MENKEQALKAQALKGLCKGYLLYLIAGTEELKEGWGKQLVLECEWFSVYKTLSLAKVYLRNMGGEIPKSCE